MAERPRNALAAPTQRREFNAILQEARRTRPFNSLTESFRERLARALSLNTPQDADLVDVGADVAAGFAPVVGTALSARDFERARRDNDYLGMGLSAVGAVPFFGGIARTINKAGRSTIRGAERKAFPGIYKDPRELARQAESMVAPESPLLGRLFGVSRADLARVGNTPGTAPGVIPNAPKRPKGAAAAEKVMYPANTRRLVDALQATETYAPRLREGMTGWYVMDPAYQRLVQIVGPEQAGALYNRFNNLTGMSSPMSDVVTELMRGTAANKLANEGRFGEYLTYGGKPAKRRVAMGMPLDMTTFPGHPAHSTAQARAMSNFLSTGSLQMKSPKVPLYIQASNASDLGRQTDIPVGDAHWSRAVGLADTRKPVTVKGKQVVPGASVSTPELMSLAPWWRNDVAKQAGVEAVPGHAITWGLFAPQTGVETAIGAPKLEIISDLIGRTAQRLGITPEQARDMVLTGKAQAGKIDPQLLMLLGAGGAAGAVGAGVAGSQKRPTTPEEPR